MRPWQPGPSPPRLSARIASGESSTGGFALHPDWRARTDDPAHGAHLVQFYEDPGALRSAVAAWAAPALERGGAAVLVATPAHADLARRGLAAGGLDPGPLEAEGRFVVVDAEGLMAKFMDQGMPDGDRFRALAGGVLAEAAAAAGATARSGQGPEVRAWGEMVNLLWHRGNLPGAQRLEALWNDVLAATGARLLCSYRVGSHDQARGWGVLRELARHHARLLPDDDEARHDAAVARALEDAFGPAEAATLWALFQARRAGGVAMPPGRAVLAGLHEVLPAMADEVLARTRHHVLATGPLPPA